MPLATENYPSLKAAKTRENNRKTSISRGKSQVRLQGLEPWTYGLKVRCSAN